MARHDDHPTPLPWEVCVWEKNVFVHGGPHNDDIAEFNFCDEHTVKITKDEAVANACLFAAAPDLLEALTALDKVLDFSEPMSEQLETPYALSRAAIAKAKVAP